MKKMIIAGWICSIGLLLAACGGNDAEDATRNSSTNTVQSTDTVTSDEQQPSSGASYEELKAKYDSVVIGDLLNAGEGGNTVDEVKANLGEPSSTSQSDAGGQEVTTLMWSSFDSSAMTTLTVMLVADKTYSKTIVGLPVEAGDAIALVQFDAFPADNTKSVDDAIAEFGNPTGISESLTGGQTTTILTYMTNINGGAGANFILQATNGLIASKTQSGME